MSEDQEVLDIVIGKWQKYSKDFEYSWKVLDFAKKDEDGNGILDKDELDKFVKKYMEADLYVFEDTSQNFQEKKKKLVDELFQKYNKDGEIDKDGYMNILKHLERMSILYYGRQFRKDVIGILKATAEKDESKKVVCEEILSLIVNGY